MKALRSDSMVLLAFMCASCTACVACASGDGSTRDTVASSDVAIDAAAEMPDSHDDGSDPSLTEDTGSVIDDREACLNAGNCWLGNGCVKNGEACDDREPCTHTDVCKAGVCKGQNVACYWPTDPCARQPYCDGTKYCKYKYLQGVSCSNLTYCSTNDTCDGKGRCIGTPVVCELDNGQAACDRYIGCYAVSCDPGFMLSQTSPTTCVNGFMQVSAGGYETCAITGQNETWCWGLNSDGQLGDGTLTDRREPVRVVDGGSAARVDVGELHACAIRTDGSLYCWGDNLYHQLGDGTDVDSARPVQVTGLNQGVTDVSAGGYHTCAVQAGRAYCWGSNAAGQVGVDSVQASFATPQAINLSNVIDVECGTAHTCATTDQGIVYCWGEGLFGKLGTGDVVTLLAPGQPVNQAGSVVMLDAGSQHSCMIRTAPDAEGVEWANLFCWGSDMYGQIGGAGTGICALGTCETGLRSELFAGADCETSPCATGETLVASWPMPADEYEPVVVAGGFHSCASFGPGNVSCAGYGHFGQLGDGWTTDRSEFSNRLDLNVRQLTAGLYHTCALDRAASLVCWGNNQYGQIGDGTVLQHNVPTAVKWNPEPSLPGY